MKRMTRRSAPCHPRVRAAKDGLTTGSGHSAASDCFLCKIGCSDCDQECPQLANCGLYEQPKKQAFAAIDGEKAAVRRSLIEKIALRLFVRYEMETVNQLLDDFARYKARKGRRTSSASNLGSHPDCDRMYPLMFVRPGGTV